MLNSIKDQFLNLRLKRDEREIKIGFFIVGLVTIILLFNVIYLNIKISKNNSAKSHPSSAFLTPTSTIIKPPPTALIPSTNATQSAKQSTITEHASNTRVSGATKDYYINLGSGTDQSSDWADVQGALTTFDFGQYYNIKEVHFEASISVPTANGTVSVRLFNETDMHPVWNSEITGPASSQSTLMISPGIIYDNAPKMYQVQMKSQLNVSANLLEARFHIIAQ